MQPSIKVGARSSNLSRAQVREVELLLGRELDPVFVLSMGDRDKQTSLRTLDKTDFFTREIDELVLKGEVCVGVHSAKDLPEPLPEGLELFALTEGLDPSDALVMREGEVLDDVKVVATSSERREECCRGLKEDLTFIDLRGTIEERLQKLEEGEADGVVVAECALMRLGIDRNRIKLPGTTAVGQGQLAIVGRKGDLETKAIFQCISILD